MISIEIEGLPVPWAAHKGFGKRSFNPRYKEREYFQWKLRQHYQGPPVECAVDVLYIFYLPIIRSASKKSQEAMREGKILHCKKPDVSNLVKFTEDCLKGVIIVDDCQVVNLTAKKIYRDNPATFIAVIPHATLCNTPNP